MAAASAILKSEDKTESFHLEIEAELKRIYASSSFRTSRRSSEFLQFIVRAALEGREDSLKERAIAMDLLGRSVSYDPGSDATVRVRAADVRKRLISYYATVPAGSGLRITLPTGSYVPAFVPEDAPQSATVETPPADTPIIEIRSTPFVKLMGGIALALILLLPLLLGARYWLQARDDYHRFWARVLDGKKMMLFSMSPEDREQLALGMYPLAWIAGRFGVPTVLSTGPLTGATTDTFAKARISVLPPIDLQGDAHLHWRLSPAGKGWLIVQQDQNKTTTLSVSHASLLTIRPDNSSILYFQSTDADTLRKILEELTARESFPDRLKSSALGHRVVQALLTVDAAGHSTTVVCEQ